jgi:N-acetylmuramic acid 6-phosphate etherase
MVDVQAVNQKLVRRSEDIVMRVTGSSRDAARTALQQARGSIKLAVMLLHGCDPERGAQLLEQAHGRLRSALAATGRRGTDAA